MLEFEPKKIEKTVISIRIQDDILSKIDKLSAERDLSRNEFIVQCIGFAIEHISSASKIENVAENDSGTEK